jgi:uncharacterized protein
MERTKLLIIIGILLALGSILWLDENVIRRPVLITVAGEGKVTAKPDMVMFTVTLVNTASSAQIAIADNRLLSANVVIALKNSGVVEKDIVASYARVVPTTDMAKYQGVNSLNVTLRDVAKFDPLFNQLYAVGAQSITNIVFTTANDKSVEKQAIDKAIAEAESRAKEIGKSTNKAVGRMLSITTGEVGGSGATVGQTSATSTPSEIEIVRQASIVYELR